MARPPKPTQLKIVSGTDQPCRVRDDEPKPASLGLNRPPNLTKRARYYWRIYKKLLLDCKVLTNLDGYALGQLCEQMAELDDLRLKLTGRPARPATKTRPAVEAVPANGPIIKGRNGYPVVSPLFRAIHQKTEQVRRMMVEFGMTPSSRTRVGTVGQAEWETVDLLAL